MKQQILEATVASQKERIAALEARAAPIGPRFIVGEPGPLSANRLQLTSITETGTAHIRVITDNDDPEGAAGALARITIYGLPMVQIEALARAIGDAHSVVYRRADAGQISLPEWLIERDVYREMEKP